MSTTETTESFDPSLKDELFAFEDASEGDIVRGEVVGVEKWSKRRGEKIRVSIRLPTGSTFDDVMDYPKGNTRDYRFVRLVESLGYSIGSAEHMIGDEVECRYTDDDEWEIVADPPKRQRVVDAGRSAIGIALLPVWVILNQYWSYRNDDWMNDTIDQVMVGGMSLLVWSIAVAVGLAIGSGIVGAVAALL